jgi:hypothetical protein
MAAFEYLIRSDTMGTSIKMCFLIPLKSTVENLLGARCSSPDHACHYYLTGSGRKTF